MTILMKKKNLAQVQGLAPTGGFALLAFDLLLLIEAKHKDN